MRGALLVAMSLILGGALAGALRAAPGRVVAGPCTAAETRGVVYAFARAWTSGDTAAAMRLVAPEPEYRWVSVGPPGQRSGRSAFTRGSLRAYLAGRHVRHDRLRLTGFRFNGSDLRGETRFGHFAVTAVRDADDWSRALRHARPAKGAIVCTDARPVLAVFSIG